MGFYVDANATSRLRLAARRTIEESGFIEPGNPSSVHQGGQFARAKLESARAVVRQALALRKGQIIFTSGGTEGCNTAIRGFLAEQFSGAKIVSSAIEHQAVLEPMARLQQLGAECVSVAPRPNGQIDVAEFVAAAVNADIALLMLANNVTGVVQPALDVLREIRKLSPQTALIVDASQVIGRILAADGSRGDITLLRELVSEGVSALVFSGHKFGALSGIGVLVIPDQDDICRRWEPSLFGGPQEGRMRAGTQNLLGAITFAAALEEIERATEEGSRIQDLRERLWTALQKLGARRAGNVSLSDMLTNTLCVGFPGIRGDDLVVALDLAGVRASTGSACSSGRQEVSHVLRAMQMERPEEFIRLSLDWDADEDLVTGVVRAIETVLTRRLSVSSEANATV